MICYTENGIQTEYATLYKVVSCKCNMCHGDSNKVSVKNTETFSETLDNNDNSITENQDEPESQSSSRY
jgi:hypothetical protein